MTRLPLLLLLMCQFLVPLDLAGGEDDRANKLRRWAIVGSPEIVGDGLPDLITVSLSEDTTIALVERQELAAAVRELELTAYGGAGAVQQRLQLGRLMSADALLLLSLDDTHDQATPMLKMVVVECRSGTRLLVDYFRMTMPR